MKLLNFKVHNSINCVLNFDNPNRYPKTYIINNGNANPILFNLSLSAGGRGAITAQLQTEKGTKDIFLLSIKDEKTTISQGDRLVSGNLCLKFIAKDYFDCELANEEQQRKAQTAFSDYVKQNITDNLTKEYPQDGSFKVIANGNDIVEYNVTISIVIMNMHCEFREETSMFKVVFCPQQHIFQATLDFGSEASQALIYNCGAARLGVTDIKNLFIDMGTTLGIEIDKNTQNDYIQHDPNPKLFRSHFFAPKSADKTRQNYFPACRPIENPHLKILTTFANIDSLKEEYFTLPNVKIASLSPNRPEITVKDVRGTASCDATEFENRYFYRSAINSFIYQVLKYTAQGNTTAYLRLAVLMPNVYNQKELSTRLRDINEDIQELLKLEEFTAIRGVEVSSISESDAAILGYFKTKYDQAIRFEKGNYLIIDAGKGTLDFSVLNINPKAPQGEVFTSLYRSGIVGSGNALTYAIFLDLMKEMLTEITEKASSEEKTDSVNYLPQGDLERAIREIINHLILGGDEAVLAELMKYLESYKRYYGTLNIREQPYPKNDVPNNSNIRYAINLEAGKLIISKLNKIDGTKIGVPLKIGSEDTILEWIKSKFSEPADPNSDIIDNTQNDFEYTRSMIEELGEAAMEGYRFNGKIDHIIVSGRAFRLNQFKNAIISRVKEREKKERVKKEREKNVKEDNSWKDNQVYNEKNICLFVNDMLAYNRYDGRMVGRPELRKYGEQKKKDLENNGESFSKKRKYSDLLAKFNPSRFKLNWLSDYFGDAHRTTLTDDDYKDGIPVNVSTVLDQVAIGGINYSLPENAVEGQEARIYFDGDKFLFVSGGTALEFNPAVVDAGHHIFESTFPYCKDPNGTNNIPIPHRKENATKTDEERIGNQPTQNNKIHSL